MGRYFSRRALRVVVESCGVAAKAVDNIALGTQVLLVVPYFVLGMGRSLLHCDDDC